MSTSHSVQRHTTTKQTSAKRTALRFSVIVCTYNRRTMVLSTLASLRRQTLPYEQFEVIVVDNGSSDGTLKAVQLYVNAGKEQRSERESWRVHCLSELRNGLAHARNTGIQAAQGEFAVFLDDDSITDPHLLERLLEAYTSTHADAIAVHVRLQWEANRPHWLTDDLLDLLGYFAPAQTRTRLLAPNALSSCCFSARFAVIRAVGGFSPLLSKQPNQPTTLATDDFCRRLHDAGYTLWYEPQAFVSHRVPVARLQRAFFVGRAYWQGRSEVIIQHSTKDNFAKISLLSNFLHDVRDFVHSTCIQRPLLLMARASTNEQLVAAMEQARQLGRVQQQLMYLQHPLSKQSQPSVLLIYAGKTDVAAQLLTQALQEQGVECTIMVGTDVSRPFIATDSVGYSGTNGRDTSVPTGTDHALSWLWQHRAYRGHKTGILHIHQPGAFQLARHQHQRLCFLLWLARRLGIVIVSSDTGGWWQNVRHTRFRHRRAFERKILGLSHTIISSTCQPAQLYANQSLRQRVRSLSYPGFRGYAPPLLARKEAYRLLGLPAHLPYVYLCLASQHTERELLQLIDAFIEMNHSHMAPSAGLLIAGVPRDRPQSTRILQRAALHSSIHCFLTSAQGELSLYFSAADALVLPYAPLPNAGVLELAMLALSYERVVIAPDLPRFHGMLPPHGSILYPTHDRSALMHALRTAPFHHYQHTEQEKLLFDAEHSWAVYARHLIELYQQLMLPS